MEVVIVLFVVLVLVAIVYGYHAAAQRRKAMAAWAAAHGMSFDPSHDNGMDDRFGEFDCLRQGSDRYAFNRMAGEWAGRGFLGFDYHYETHSTDSKGRRTTSHHHFSAVILDSKVPLRPLFIRPEGFFDKVTEFFGYDDIDFESAEFSRKFYVKSPDRRWAYDVIHQRTMEFLLAAPRFTMEFDRHHVIAYRSGQFKAAEFAAAAEVVAGMLERMPEYLVRQQTGQG